MSPLTGLFAIKLNKGSAMVNITMLVISLVSVFVAVVTLGWGVFVYIMKRIQEVEKRSVTREAVNNDLHSIRDDVKSTRDDVRQMTSRIDALLLALTNSKSDNVK